MDKQTNKQTKRPEFWKHPTNDRGLLSVTTLKLIIESTFEYRNEICYSVRVLKQKYLQTDWQTDKMAS